ncbi:MAG TPA: DUF2975 domain-containing protein [Micromonosporaceae bacterium]|jgi:hypothetical protein
MTALTGSTGRAVKARNPLEPITSIIGLLVSALCALAAFAVALSLFGNDVGVLGFGRSFPTVTVPNDTFDSRTHIYGWTARPGVSVQPSRLTLNTGSPDFAQRFWFTLAGLPALILIVGALLLARRLLKRAQFDGIYTVDTARRLRTLGWFLVVGALARMVITAVANIQLAKSMVTNRDHWGDLSFWHMPWLLLVFGATLMTIARIVRVGAQMNDELEATV